MFLISENELRVALKTMKIEKYYMILDMNGAITLYLPINASLEKEKILKTLSEIDERRTLDQMNNLMYPFMGTVFEEIDEQENLNDFNNQKIVHSKYHQQLNSWHIETCCLEENSQLPPIVTFYSYKGGVGRSTALAITARLLSNNGFKVAVIDFDLEAPGINSLLLVKPKTAPFGVVDYLYHQPLLKQKINKERFLSQYIVKEEVIRRNKRPGQLWVMTAGGTRVHNENKEVVRRLFDKSNDVDIRLDDHYLEKLSYIDFDIYARQDESAFQNLLNDVAKYTEADIILLDARTGLSSVSGILLKKYSDVISVHVHDNKQNREGIEFLVDQLCEQVIMQKVLWSHTKVPKNYNTSAKGLTYFIKSLIERKLSVLKKNKIESDNLGEFEIKVKYLPFADILEDVTAQGLQNLIENDYISVHYKELAEHVARAIGMESKLKLTIIPSVREQIRAEYEELVRGSKVTTYIARRFLDPDLKKFIGFPGSGKTTLEQYFHNSGKSIDVIDFVEFREELHKQSYNDLNSVTFLDWSFEEATQGVCKWLLQSETLIKWISELENIKEVVQLDDLVKMSQEPCYELPMDIAEDIINIVIPKQVWPRLKRIVNMSIWKRTFRMLQYREGYVLPRDIMIGIQLIITHLIEKNRENDYEVSETIFSTLHLRNMMQLFRVIGKDKEDWLNSYDTRIVCLINAYRKREDEIDFGEEEEEEEEEVNNIFKNYVIKNYPDVFDVNSFEDILNITLDMGIFRLEDDKKIKMSSIYRLIG